MDERQRPKRSWALESYCSGHYKRLQEVPELGRRPRAKQLRTRWNENSTFDVEIQL